MIFPGDQLRHERSGHPVVDVNLTTQKLTRQLTSEGTVGSRAGSQSHIMSQHALSRRSAMPQSRTLSLGLEVHKESSAVASVAQAHHAAVVSLGHIGTRQCDLEQLSRKRQAKRTQILFGSAAGPCGYWRSRSLPHTGQGCWVVAPSLLPHKPGDRVKTNRRDTSTLARLMRAGDRPPSTSPRGTMQRCGTYAGRVPRPSARSRPRSVGAPPCSCGTLSGTPAEPPGSQPTADGAGNRTHCTSGTSTDRPRAALALRPGRRSAPGPPRGALHGRGAPRGRTRRPPPLRAPQPAHALPGRNAVRIVDGRAPPTGRQPADWHPPGPPGAGRRRRGLSLPHASQPASAATPGDGVHAAPRAQWAGPETPGQTLPTPERQREKGPPGGRCYRAGTAGVDGGHGPGGSTDALTRHPGKPSSTVL
jgi:hypothetical protein